jgi:hypothetical protein
LALFSLRARVYGADAAARQEIAQRLAREVQQSLPFAALTALSWSDAYIGQLVSRKPHFGVGIAYGLSVADFSSLRTLLDASGVNAYMDTGAAFMPPLYGAVRLGGFFAPFDIGFAASLPFAVQTGAAFTLDQQMFAGDIRFAALRDEAKLPGISIGLGFTEVNGEIAAEAENGAMRVQWTASAIELKGQVSKTLAGFTPYFGTGVSFTWSRAGYRINGAGETWGMEPENYANDILFRVFGGTSANFGYVKLDFCANMSIPAFDYGVLLGLRFQL